MSEKFDIVVIGAGPAGLSAALEAARTGCSVLLVERHERVAKYINCAEGVTIGAISDWLDIKPEWILNRIERGVLISPSGIRFELEHPRAGYIIDRARMQQSLAESFVEAGGTLRTGQMAIQFNTGNGIMSELIIEDCQTRQSYAVRADAFIDAEGVDGRLARSAGIDNLMYLDRSESLLQYRLGGIEFDPEAVEIRLGWDIAPRSYLWIFPRGQAEVSVGLGVPSDSEDKARRLLERFIAVRFPGAHRMATACGTTPRYQSPATMAVGNLLLVGDAARLLDSVTGAGIALSIISGKMSGRAASAFCQGRVSDLKGMYDIYPAGFVREKHRLLNGYLRVKEVMDKMTDREFDEAVEGFCEAIPGKKVDSVNALELFLGIIRKKPRLLTLARHLL